MYLVTERLWPIRIFWRLSGETEEIHKTRQAFFRTGLCSEVIIFPVAGSVVLGSTAAAKAVEEIVKEMQLQESAVVMGDTMQQGMM
jgi:hypothetical protein